VVDLDTAVTPELEAEGLSRDVIRLVQQARKDADLHVSDRITAVLSLDAAHAAAVEAHLDTLRAATLAVAVKVQPTPTGASVVSVTVT